jgi:RimJ/RimL family protein N-acetyltransferase
MREHELGQFHIRRLHNADFPAFRRHFKRLDTETRQARFGTPVNDDFLDSYVSSAHQPGNIVFGAFADREIRASAELRGLDHVAESAAEAAFTVEKSAQEIGLGTLLMDRIITVAQNRQIGQIHMMCLRDNNRMKRLARKFGARLQIARDNVTGNITPSSASVTSVFDEIWHDAAGYVTAVLEWRV